MATVIVCHGSSLMYVLLIVQHAIASHWDRHALIGYACQAVAWELIAICAMLELKRKDRVHTPVVRAWGVATFAGTVVSAWAALPTLKNGGGGGMTQLDAALPFVTAGLGLLAFVGAIDGRASRRRSRRRRSSPVNSGTNTPSTLPVHDAPAGGMHESLLSEASESDV